jgi:hypothetical protein
MTGGIKSSAKRTQIKTSRRQPSDASAFKMNQISTDLTLRNTHKKLRSDFIVPKIIESKRDNSFVISQLFKLKECQSPTKDTKRNMRNVFDKSVNSNLPEKVESTLEHETTNNNSSIFKHSIAIRNSQELSVNKMEPRLVGSGENQSILLKELNQFTKSVNTRKQKDYQRREESNQTKKLKHVKK